MVLKANILWNVFQCCVCLTKREEKTGSNTFIYAIYQGQYSVQHAMAFIWKIFEMHIPSFAVKYCRECWNIWKCRYLLVKYVFCLFVLIRLEVMLSWNCIAIQLAVLAGILSWVSINIQAHYISPWLPFHLVVEMSAVCQYCGQSIYLAICGEIRWRQIRWVINVDLLNLYVS